MSERVNETAVFSEIVTLYGGNWRRRYCRRRGHVLVITLTDALTLQSVCLRCHTAGDIEGIVTMFRRLSTPPTNPAHPGSDTTDAKEAQHG